MKELLTILLLVLISVPASWNLLQPGGFTSHDLTHHVVRQISMDKILSEGQFPPRWSSELVQGFGYPLFLFNYPLPTLLAEIFVKIGLGYLDAIKAVMVSAFTASALGMYLFLKQLLGLRSAAFLGSIFYLYAPIRFLSVYVSAAFGSAVAFAFIPFIFYSLVNIAKGGGKVPMVVGILSTAALILSHNTTALMFAPIILMFMVLMMIRFKLGVVGIKMYGLIILLGAGLSCWFWLPALAEKQFTKYDAVMGVIYKDHFPALNQLIYSPWGFGFSNLGPNDGLSFQIGVIHLLVILLLTLITLTRYKLKGYIFLAGFILTLFLISVFLMLEISLPLWEKIPLLNYVLYPPRFLIVSVFSASIASGLVIRNIPLKAVFFLTLLALVLYANRNHLGINQKTFHPESYYLSIKDSGTSFAEHLPRWAKEPQEDSQNKLTLLGNGEIVIVEDRSTRVVANIKVDTDSVVRLNQFYFPGWQVSVDEKLVDLNYQDAGLPKFKLKSGEHQILAEFKKTPIRAFADIVSLLSVIVLASYLRRFVVT